MTPKQQNLIYLLQRLLSLLVVFLMLAAAAVWTGRLFGRDIGLSANKAEEKKHAVQTTLTADALSALGLPTGVSLTPKDSATWLVAAGDSGVIVSSKPFTKDVQGFSGPVPVYVWFDADGVICGIAAADNAETPDFFRSAFESIAPAWKGQSAESASPQVDAVTGATYTRRALTANIHAAVDAYNASTSAYVVQPAIGWAKTIAVGAVLIIGIAVSLIKKKQKWLRIALLLLNVGVLGFWCGQFLSLSLLKGFVANGFDPIIALPSVLMLAASLLLPLFGRKKHYCTWVCPFGSLQELAAMVGLPHIKIGQKAWRVMGQARTFVLALLLLLLWTGFGAWLLDYEPFSAFIFTTASPAVLILAGTFVVTGLFVPRLWCHTFCPVGELLGLAETSSKKNNPKK